MKIDLMLATIRIGVVLCALSPCAASAMDFAVVDEPCNPPDPCYGFGCVDYVFEIGKYEVSNAEYAAFLNAVARYDDPCRLYHPSMSDGLFGGIDREKKDGGFVYRCKPYWERRPVVYISWYDLARMANWRHYGSPDTGRSGEGITEGTASEGAYDTRRFPKDHDEIVSPGSLPTRRNPRATYWIPNEDEWFKAAYYDPTRFGKRPYWDYAVRACNLPVSEPPPGGPLSANYFHDTFAAGKPFFLTEVGAYKNARSYFGTFDQAGNAWEWLENWRSEDRNGEKVRGLRGGSATYSFIGLHASNTDPGNPSHEVFIWGGRLARAHQTPSGTLSPSSGNAVIMLRFFKQNVGTPAFLVGMGLGFLGACLSGAILCVIMKRRHAILAILTRPALDVYVLFLRLRRRATARGALALMPAARGSLGDEAILYGLLSAWRQQNVDRIALLPYSKQDGWLTCDENRFHVSTDCCFEQPWWRLAFGFAKLVSTYDSFYLLGADVLDGYYSRKHSLRRIRLASLASRIGARTTVVGFSFGEKAPKSIVAALRRLPREVRLCLRDPKSHDTLRPFCPRAELVADAAFLLEPDDNDPALRPILTWISERRQEGKIILGLNANALLCREMVGGTVENLISCFVGLLAKLREVHPELAFCVIPHDTREDGSSPSDDTLALRILQALPDDLRQSSIVVRSPFSAAGIKGLAGRLDCAVVSRMHLAIACLGQGAPVAAITYTSKFEGLFEHFRLPGMTLPAKDLDDDARLLSLVDSLVSNRRSLQNHILRQLPRVLAMAKLNACAFHASSSR